MDIINGPAGGIVHSRMIGTKVQLAGRQAYLPDIAHPILIQDMTLKQIAAIPRDQFFVSVVEVSMPPVMSRSGFRKGFTAQKFRQLQRYRQERGGDVIGLVSKTTPDIPQIEAEGTKTFKTLTMLLGMTSESLENLETLFRTAMMNPKAAEPDTGIFCKPIDENRLANCILEIIKRFFGTKDTCLICSWECKLVEFCVLMHFYFIRLGILENKTRKAFCEYLLKKVFGNLERFAVKTFNNYANKHQSVEYVFTHKDALPIDFETHSKSRGNVQGAFQEIGYAFHNSPYFGELREMMNRMMNWGL